MPQAGALWGVAAYFNSTGSRWMQPNLLRFSERARRQGLRLLVVELAYGDQPYEVGDGVADLIVRRRADALLWQKERLLNIGIASLPADCEGVVWLDADVLFENDDWVHETARLLGDHAAVQPFDTASWLGPDGSIAQTQRGMAATLASHPNRRSALADHFLHGHPGFAWAIRRDILDRHGMYDRAVLGGGDTIQAHALYGDTDFWRGRNVYSHKLTRRELEVIARWSAALSADVGGRIGFVPGRVTHLYHGELAGRQYMQRVDILKTNDYDPDADIALGDGDCWRWNSDKPAFHAAVAAYFGQRSAP